MKVGKRHHRARDITGLKVGYLTAETYVGSDGKKSLWRTVCVCGAVRVYPAAELTKGAKKGHIMSCGCRRSETIARRVTRHGMSRHKGYAVWDSMLARCYRESCESYPHYGGRGIQVCDSRSEEHTSELQSRGHL